MYHYFHFTDKETDVQTFRPGVAKLGLPLHFLILGAQLKASEYPSPSWAG